MALNKYVIRLLPIDTNSLEENGSKELQVKLASGEGLESTATGLRIKAGEVSNDMLAGSIAYSKLILAGAVADSDMVEDYIKTSEVDGSSIEFAGGNLNVKASGVTDTMLAGSISFSKLADSANIARLDQAESVGAVWAFGSNLPTASADPSSPNELARKAYVDSVAQGLDVKDSVRMATSNSIADLSDVTVADIDGQGQGITLVEGDRVLVKEEASADGIEAVDPKRNGIYVVGVVAAGQAPMTRASDADTSDDLNAGMFCFVEEGDHADQGFVLITNDPITLDTTGLSFSQFSGAGSIADDSIGSDQIQLANNTSLFGLDSGSAERSMAKISDGDQLLLGDFAGGIYLGTTSLGNSVQLQGVNAADDGVFHIASVQADDHVHLGTGATLLKLNGTELRIDVNNVIFSQKDSAGTGDIDLIYADDNDKVLVGNSGTDILLTGNLDHGQIATAGATDHSEPKSQFLAITATEISNKYIDLAGIPLDAESLTIFWGGSPLEGGGVSYDLITDGSDIKRISWNAMDLDGVIADGDELYATYTVAGADVA